VWRRKRDSEHEDEARGYRVLMKGEGGEGRNLGSGAKGVWVGARWVDTGLSGFK